MKNNSHFLHTRWVAALVASLLLLPLSSVVFAHEQQVHRQITLWALFSVQQASSNYANFIIQVNPPAPAGPMPKDAGRKRSHEGSALVI